MHGTSIQNQLLQGGASRKPGGRLAKVFRELVRFAESCRLVGLVGFLGVFTGTPSARGEHDLLLDSPRLMLGLAAESRTDTKEDNPGAARVWESGLRCEILTRQARLLPEGLSEDAKARLVSELLKPHDPSEPGLRESVASFPGVDELDYDGERYVGGNLNFIDSILSETGRPIAFDRELPAILVPLSPEAEGILNERRLEFQKATEAGKAGKEAKQSSGSQSGSGMFAEGQFLRTYVGRFDDLYFHLFQHGNGASALAFCALADGLVGRVYHPVFGLLRQATAPVAPYDLDDILADGAKAAVQRHFGAASGRAEEPFHRFAYRLVPGLVGKAHRLRPGARIIATRMEIQQALQTTQRLYPTRVPPLYRSPDRFLGWSGSLFIPVANAPTLPPGAANSWYPLPERAGQTTAESSADDVASEQLFESSSTSDLVWEDPQFSDLLADPGDRNAGRTGALHERSAGASPNPQVESDPRRRVAVARLIAIVTPQSEEARQYATAIASNDEMVRAIERRRGRVRLLSQFIESAENTSTGAALEKKSGQAAAVLHEAITRDLASLAQREQDLVALLQEALHERGKVRGELEERLRDRARQLQSLGKPPANAVGQVVNDRAGSLGVHPNPRAFGSRF